MTILGEFAAPVRAWFEKTLGAPTRVQELGWPAIRAGRSALLFAPTGSGKTLAAFLAALDELMFAAEAPEPGVKVLYVSPLKALASDVERNLQLPLLGIAQTADELRVGYRRPSLWLRSGDTPARERAQFLRRPSDILITTPESLYLMLTSEAARHLTGVRTLIIDEIHSLVTSKRGAHLALSIERLEALREGRQPLQRLGLSATQRPYEEAARLLGGASVRRGQLEPRPIDVVDAGAAPLVELRVEAPAEDMQRVSELEGRSIWPSIHQPLLELIRAHRSTLVFVNNRRLAERLSQALNELAGEELVLAHHGSVARDRRQAIEQALKRGEVKALAATSSLELGIDMGAIDLVVQIEAPPSVASGLQRIGRAGHHVGEISKGVVFPKHRGDLLACAAAAAAIQSGQVEATRYPRNPLDVLAQQIVAIVSGQEITADALYDLVRGAAPFAELGRAAFEGTLDMLSGRYPSDEFAELRPRVTWDRTSGVLTARQGARRIAIVNAGTIPDRGLYGVYLSGGDGRATRIGELDEEMVFESRVGEVFLLGASSWRIAEITFERVVVAPAPGEPGKMPFWRGDRAGRSLELGRRIGALARELDRDREGAARLLGEGHALSARSAQNLLTYLDDQQRASGLVPTDRRIVVERFEDEAGDQRVCLLSPFGTRVHAPWALAVLERERRQGREIEVIWSDDGIVFRFPEAMAAPGPEVFALAPGELDELVTSALGRSALFASRFRENAARALLLPRRHPQRRSPLWAQRKRAADLLAVASRFPAFPILLETYRDVLSDVFDLAGLRELLGEIGEQRLELRVVDVRSPTPFAAALLFAFAANFIYEGDTPLAERRAQALSIDHAQLRELLGEAELRELLSPQAIAEVERRLQRLGDERRLRHPDHVHDLLLALGDLSFAELAERAAPDADLPRWLAELVGARRIVTLVIAGQERYAAAEDAGRLCAALGLARPDLPEVFLEPGSRPLVELVARYARTHGPFEAEAPATRFGVDLLAVKRALAELVSEGRALEGAFLAGGRGHEFCEREALAAIKHKSLALLRAQVEPVPPSALALLYADWQGIGQRRAGSDALLAAIEQLEGASLPASSLEADVLPARIVDYEPGLLDELMLGGELVWVGVESLGDSDGRIALYRSDRFDLLAPPPRRAEGELCERLREILAQRGASFFADLVRQSGAFPPDLLRALWDMVWAGELKNDTLLPLRSRLEAKERDRKGRGRRHPRPRGMPGSEGRWSLVSPGQHSEASRRLARVRTLLERFGVVTRDAAQSDGLALSFSEAYPVLKALEEAGKVRRGYFVEGLGGAQFAEPGADERLRLLRREPRPETLLLAAVDPANPYGAALPWPHGGRCQRTPGAYVVLFRGELVAYLGKTEQTLFTFLPADEPEREHAAQAIAHALRGAVDGVRRRALLIAEIDGAAAASSELARALTNAGFSNSTHGLLLSARHAQNGTERGEV